MHYYNLTALGGASAELSTDNGVEDEKMVV